MLLLPNGYAIKNEKNYYAVSQRKINKKTGAEVYKARWFFVSLSKAVQFCIDRAVIVPKSLELMADELENLKTGVEYALKSIVADAKGGKVKL
jgi:hypothetical protein